MNTNSALEFVPALGYSRKNPISSSELDAKSRQNAVMQFNKGRYDILIANDQADIDEVIQEGEHTKVDVIFKA